MLSYPYMLAVYRAILAHSAAIQGRVFMAPFFASELNTENLQQILADSLDGKLKKQYPLSLVLPPISENEVGTSGTWEDYLINQLFLKQEGLSGNGTIQDINPFTNTSQHTITDDWHDMRRVAMNFIATFREVARDTPLGGLMRISERVNVRVVPVTRLGNDRANGVLITYRASIFDMCQPADYPGNVASLVTLPTGDQHPEHHL